jgi:hypothetical protein
MSQNIAGTFAGIEHASPSSTSPPIQGRHATHVKRLLLAVLTVAVAVSWSMTLVAGAQAATPGPGLTIDSSAVPAVFGADHENNVGCQPFGEPTTCDTYQLTITNTGARATDGTPITITDTLPSGLTVLAVALKLPRSNDDYGGLYCDMATVRCQYPDALAPDDSLRMIVYVSVDDPAATGTLTNAATVSGGGAPSAGASSVNAVGHTVAAFGASSLSSYVAGLDGLPDTQAGSHPYGLTTKINLASIARADAEGEDAATSIEDVKDVVVDLPLGFVGSAQATPRCTFAQLASFVFAGRAGCPEATIVGHLSTKPGNQPAAIDTAIYNMVPERGYAAEFGYVDAISAPHALYARVVPGPDGYILRVSGVDVPQVTLTDITTTFYGNPVVRDGSGDPLTAMFTNPSSCDGRPLVTTAYLDSWQHPGRKDADGNPDLSDPNWASTSTSSPPVTGCNKLRFASTLRAQPDTSSADSPSGLDFELKVPQSSDPNALATPPLKKAVVTLPVGVSVNPDAADGLSACSPAQIALDSGSSPACPDSSKIGSVELTTPLLPGTLGGSIYLATQNDNPFHSVLAGYIVVDDPVTGVVIKIPGKLTTDPSNGQITGVFDNNPQFPFSDLKLRFFGGTRGSLATPDSCGSFTTASELTPWSAPDSGPPITPGDAFTIASGCTGGFAPSFTAGVVNPAAAGSSTFTLQVNRADGQQHIKSVTTTLPPGILAKVGSVAQCSDADAAAGTCSDASQVGTTDVSAGPGALPFHVKGKVFLTGPYKGGPYGLSIVTRAVAGPFDLGTVVVRAAIKVDPIDAHVTAVSDDVPNILDVKGDDGQTNGFPLRVRSIAVNMDRPGFMVNPTSCDPMSITGSIGSWEGTTAAVSSRFQAGGCSALPVDPKLAIALTGKGQTTDDKHPGVDATLTQKPGQANLKKVVVTLPLSLALDPDNAQALCEFTDGSKVDPTCPKTSIVGTATARTPILDGPLTGSVYFVKNIRIDAKSGRQIRTLPKLVIPLTGPNGVRLNLTGTSNVVDNHLVNTFDQIPDAPVSDFKLNIDGGKHGILVVSGTDICKSTQVATQQVDGQNGKSADADIYLQTPACALKILSKKVGKTTVAIKIGGLGAGKVTVTGKGIKRTTKTITKSTVATITVKRTKGKPGKVTVSFDPTGPAKAHKTTK